jgi:hypothetical protein
MAFDVYTSYATATRYPRPGGGMPRTPSKNALKVGIADVTSLVGEIKIGVMKSFPIRLV